MADCKVVDPPIDWELIEKWSSTSMKGKGSYSTARKLCFAATIYNLWLQRNYLLVGGRVEGWKAKECCGLEDGANLHSLVCLEGEKS
jgi:hypothetical protein